MIYTELSLMGVPGKRHSFVIPVLIDDFDIQLENDLDTFFSLDEFAQEIGYTAVGESQVPIDAIVIRDEPFQEPHVRGEHVATLKLYVKASDMPDPRYGDSFEIDGDTWVYQPSNNLTYLDDHVLHIFLERELVKTKTFAKSIILLETGDYILLETGDAVLKE